MDFTTKTEIISKRFAARICGCNLFNYVDNYKLYCLLEKKNYCWKKLDPKTNRYVKRL